MQSSRLPTAMQEILKDKLECIEVKHAEVLKATESLGEHVTKVKDQLCNLVSAESYTAKDALTLAGDVDELLEELTKYHQAISSMKYGLSVPRPCDRLMDPITGQYGHTCQTDVFTDTSDINMDKRDGSLSLNILMIQVEVLQKQVSSLQDSHETRLQELETKVMLKNDQDSADDQVCVENNFDLRLQDVEAQNLLIKDVQLREDTSIRNVENELSRLRTDVLSMQDDINRLDVHQDVIGERIDDVKRKVDDLIRLRKILNDLHLNVTQREELTQKLKQLEEEVTTLNCVVDPLMTQIAKNIPGETAPMPVFVAQATERNRVKPGDKICFSVTWQECDGYNSATSIFTAPIGGIYLFSVSLNADSTGLLAATVVCNDEDVAYCGTSGIKDEQASTTVFLRLTPGDRVWVKAYDLTHPDGVYVGRGFSNFIGCCLKINFTFV